MEHGKLGPTIVSYMFIFLLSLSIIKQWLWTDGELYTVVDLGASGTIIPFSVSIALFILASPTSLRFSKRTSVVKSQLILLSGLVQWTAYLRTDLSSYCLYTTSSLQSISLRMVDLRKAWYKYFMIINCSRSIVSWPCWPFWLSSYWRFVLPGLFFQSLRFLCRFLSTQHVKWFSDYTHNNPQGRKIIEVAHKGQGNN